MTANLSHLQRLTATRYEYGVDRGMLAVPFTEQEIDDLRDVSLDTNLEHILENRYLLKGVPWNGLTKVSEKVIGGEFNHQWADNSKYIRLQTPESIEGSMEFFTYPPELDEFSDTTNVVPGLSIGGQAHKTSPKTFSLVYATNRVTLLTEGMATEEKVFHIIGNVHVNTNEISRETTQDTTEPDLYTLEFKSDPISSVYSTKKGLKPFSKVELVLYNVNDRASSFYSIFRNRIWMPISEMVPENRVQEWMKKVSLVATLDYYIYILGEGN